MTHEGGTTEREGRRRFFWVAAAVAIAGLLWAGATLRDGSGGRAAVETSPQATGGREPVMTTETAKAAAPSRPTIDLVAPAAFETATFALG
jgi:hypothetical protein